MSIRDGRLYCGKCGAEYEHTADDDLSLLEHAQNDDWCFDANGMDICPDCQHAEGEAI